MTNEETTVQRTTGTGAGHDVSEVEAMVRKALKDDPLIIGIEENALVVNAGNGRVRLVALTDLIDPSELENESNDIEYGNKET